MNAIEKHRFKLIELCHKHKVRSLHAFGSVLTNDFREDSNIDLLVSFQSMDYGDYADHYFELAEALEKLFHRSVDLVTEKSLSNPYFMKSVNQNKQLIYGG